MSDSDSVSDFSMIEDDDNFSANLVNNNNDSDIEVSDFEAEDEPQRNDALKRTQVIESDDESEEFNSEDESNARRRRIDKFGTGNNDGYTSYPSTASIPTSPFEPIEDVIETRIGNRVQGYRDHKIHPFDKNPFNLSLFNEGKYFFFYFQIHLFTLK